MGTINSSQVNTPLELNVRSLDGSGNNLSNPNLGRANTPYARIAAPNYVNGIGEMVAGPNARYISNRVFNDLAQNLFSENNVTQWAFTWGQFLDHTFGLRGQGGEDAPIPFNPNDPLEQFQNDLGVISFQRSAVAPGTAVDSPREQINTVSSYIDGWAVYGGTNERLEWLREGPVDGDLGNNSARLLTAENGYLPRANARGDAATAPMMDLQGRLLGNPENAAIAGDMRANENIALTAVHTLFVREHNRIVDVLPDGLNEETKFQIARKIVGAEQQYITYNEFLPALGVRLDPYQGYSPTVDPSLSNEFATVGYRTHSMIHGEIEVATLNDYSTEQLDALRAQGIEVEVIGEEIELAVPLNVAFGNPDLVPTIGLDPILVGLASEAQYKNDEQIDNQLRSVLFQLPVNSDGDLDGPELPNSFTTVLDIGAIDIQRGRDHGIPTYNELRSAYGLKPVTSFTEITGEDSEEFPQDPDIDSTNPLNDPDILTFNTLFDINGNPLELGTEAADSDAVTGIRQTPLAARLKAIYGDVDNIDAFVGTISEQHLPGTEFGELQLAMWREQFEALRDGDRFFYLNDLDLAKIEEQYGITYQHTLADIIGQNTALTKNDIQSNVFLLEDPNIVTTPEPYSPLVFLGLAATCLVAWRLKKQIKS